MTRSLCYWKKYLLLSLNSMALSKWLVIIAFGFHFQYWNISVLYIFSHCWSTFLWPCKSHYYSLQHNEYELIYFVILIHFSYLYSPHLTSASHYLSAVYPVMIKISSHSCHHVQVPMYKRNSKLMTSTFRWIMSILRELGLTVRIFGLKSAFSLFYRTMLRIHVFLL